MIVPDTSVVIAAAAPWHVLHEPAARALAAETPALIAHVAYETTAALSRMPEGHRISPSVVLEWIDQRFPHDWLVLPPREARTTLHLVVARGIRGGSLYDALVAGTAKHHGQPLLTADRRAAPTYAAVGVDAVEVAS